MKIKVKSKNNIQIKLTYTELVLLVKAFVDEDWKSLALDDINSFLFDENKFDSKNELVQVIEEISDKLLNVLNNKPLISYKKDTTINKSDECCKNYNNYIHTIHNEKGEEILISEKQYLYLLELKQKLENIVIPQYLYAPININTLHKLKHDLEKSIEKYNDSGLPMKVIVFVSDSGIGGSLVYREYSDDLVEIVGKFD